MPETRGKKKIAAREKKKMPPCPGRHKKINKLESTEVQYEL